MNVVHLFDSFDFSDSEDGHASTIIAEEVSESFTVFSAKKFPGMTGKHPLTFLGMRHLWFNIADLDPTSHARTQNRRNSPRHSQSKVSRFRSVTTSEFAKSTGNSILWFM